jgi:hypothetical protein
VVGDDAVDAEVEQRVHRRLVVDGPDVQLDSVGMRVREQRFGNERTVREFERNLERHRGRIGRRSSLGAADYRQNVFDTRPLCDAQVRFGKPVPQASHDVTALRGQEGEGRTLQSRDDLGRCLDRSVSHRLDLEVEAHSRKRIQ